MAKLTVTIHQRTIERASRYARARGTSVSRLVESYLVGVAAHDEAARPAAPVLERLRGSLRDGDLAEHRRALARKYR